MQEMIINLGGAADKTRIALSTSKNRPIPNSRRQERPPEAMRAAMEITLNGGADRKLRSLSSTYNCFGMVFANRRTCIEPDAIPDILEDDGYVAIDSPAAVSPGDIVIYERSGEISHVAVVISNNPNCADGSSSIMVLSQWGSDGEYFHDHSDVPPLLGRPAKFYSERRKP